MSTKHLNRFWDTALRNRNAGVPQHRGWGTELRMLNRVVRKDGLAHAMQFAALNDVGAAVPEAWVLPHSRRAWDAAVATAGQQSGDLWIYKPAVGSCGEGVVVGSGAVIRSLLKDSDTAGVVQRYKMDPYLIGGLKFDLRCYIVLVSAAGTDDLQPRCYLFLDGLARFATQKYRGVQQKQQQSSSPLASAEHLTNYSTNQTAVAGLGVLERWAQWWSGPSRGGVVFKESSSAEGAGGVDGDGNVIAHKWSAAAALLYMRNGGDGPMWSDIARMIAGVMNGVSLSTLGRCKTQSISRIERSNTRNFELLGVDVLFDAQGTPNLIELQRRPNLAPTSALDVRVKTELLDGLDVLLSWHKNSPSTDAQALLPGWVEVKLAPLQYNVPRSMSTSWEEWHRVDGEIGKTMRRAVDSWKAIEANNKAEAESVYG